MIFPRSSKLFMALGAATSLLLLSSAFADTIVLKSGEKIEGKLVFESDVMIKVEVKITESINETKTFARGDVAEIIKVAADAEKFNQIQQLVPTRSLLSAADYTSMIETGPVAFKAAFPDSEFLSEVEKIEATLREELDKVERGSIKLDNEWVGVAEKKEKTMLVGSRIAKFRYDSYYNAGNFIAALREFDNLQTNYEGTPAHLAAIENVDDLLKGYGSFLTKKLNNVDYLNAQDAEAQKRLDPQQLEQVQRARQNEIARYEAQQEADDEAGFEWFLVDHKDKSDLESTIKQVTSALEDVADMDPEKIGGPVEKLVQADDLIFQNELGKAEEILEEIGVAAKKPSTKKSTKSTKAKSVSYREHIAMRMGTALFEREEAIKQAAAEGDAKALVAEIAGKKKAPEGEAAEEGAEGEEGENTPDADAGDGPSALEIAMMKKKEAAAAKRKAESEGSKSGSDVDEEDEEEEKKKKRPPVDDGGGISFQMIMIGFVLIMAIVIGVLKFTGIGGGKKSEDEEPPAA